MNDIEQILGELLDEIMPTIHAAESTGDSILRVLKDKNIVSEAELAPYLEQASNASSVRQRAARLRVERLFASAMKSLQNAAENSAKKLLEERLSGENGQRSGEASPANKEPQHTPDDKRAQDAQHAEKSEESKAGGTHSEESGRDTTQSERSQPEEPAAHGQKVAPGPGSGENAA